MDGCDWSISCLCRLCLGKIIPSTTRIGGGWVGPKILSRISEEEEAFPQLESKARSCSSILSLYTDSAVPDKTLDREEQRHKLRILTAKGSAWFRVKVRHN